MSDEISLGGVSEDLPLTFLSVKHAMTGLELAAPLIVKVFIYFFRYILSFKLAIRLHCIGSWFCFCTS